VFDLLVDADDEQSAFDLGDRLFDEAVKTHGSSYAEWGPTVPSMPEVFQAR
jgi:hypothetical protein